MKFQWICLHGASSRSSSGHNALLVIKQIVVKVIEQISRDVVEDEMSLQLPLSETQRLLGYPLIGLCFLKDFLMFRS